MKFVAAAALALLFATRAHANGPEVGIDAGMIVPLESKDVALVGEQVNVWISAGDEPGRLECIYVLRNRSSKPVKLSMGFLVNSPSIDPAFPGHWDDPALGLEVRIAGNHVAVRREPVRAKAWEAIAPGGMPDSLPVWDVQIPANGRVSLEIKSRITWSGGSDGDEHTSVLSYAAIPARLWAGSITYATVDFHFEGPTLALLRQARNTKPEDADRPGGVALTITPPAFKWTRTGVRWTFVHWEPAENPKVQIDWRDPPGSE